MAENATTDIAAGLVWRDISLDVGSREDWTPWSADTVSQGDLGQRLTLGTAALPAAACLLAATIVGLATFFATNALFTPVTGGPAGNDEAAFVFATIAAITTVFVAPNLVSSRRS